MKPLNFNLDYTPCRTCGKLTGKTYFGQCLKCKEAGKKIFKKGGEKKIGK